MSAPPLLELRALTRDYPLRGGGRFRALDGVSLTLEAGRILAVVGESGSGKSTLARLAVALDRPTGGEVLFGGESLHALSARELRARRRGFQMVFQDPAGSLDPRQRVGRIVAEPLHLLPDAPGGRERLRLAERMLERVGLRAADASRYPHEFSGGQRQRIAIARALITRPQLLVADEAVSALDVLVQGEILRLILALREETGMGVLFITHDIAVVEEIADEVAVMVDGRVVETGPCEAVLSRPREDYTRRLLDAVPRWRG